MPKIALLIVGLKTNWQFCANLETCPNTCQFGRCNLQGRSVTSVVTAKAIQKCEIEGAVDLLGGARSFSPAVHNLLDVHQAILEGFPNRTLTYLADHVALLQQDGLMAKAIGISLRTLRLRKMGSYAKPLSKSQSNRVWAFATTLARATRVLGTQEGAEFWLSSRAIGLNQQRPIDLIATNAGLRIVKHHLDQIEFGVYV